MDAFIYQADLWCADCGRAIRERLDSEYSANVPDKTTGKEYNPPTWDTPETEYDSDEYPKGPYSDGGGESDCPQHCASGADCLNALELADGHKVGCWLENPLTSEGARYVKETVADGRGCVTHLWAKWYAEEIEYA